MLSIFWAFRPRVTSASEKRSIVFFICYFSSRNSMPKRCAKQGAGWTLTLVSRFLFQYQQDGFFLSWLVAHRFAGGIVAYQVDIPLFIYRNTFQVHAVVLVLILVGDI